jgi:hypothetical protein
VNEGGREEEENHPGISAELVGWLRDRKPVPGRLVIDCRHEPGTPNESRVRSRSSGACAKKRFCMELPIRRKVTE